MANEFTFDANTVAATGLTAAGGCAVLECLPGNQYWCGNTLGWLPISSTTLANIPGVALVAEKDSSNATTGKLFASLPTGANSTLPAGAVTVRALANQSANPVFSGNALQYLATSDYWNMIPANVLQLPSIPANWITASGIGAGALNGKGDWVLTTHFDTIIPHAFTYDANTLPNTNVAAKAAGVYRVAAATGNWESSGTWAGGVIPSAGDNIVIQTLVTVTITSSSTNPSAYGTLELQGISTLAIGSGVAGISIPRGWVVASNAGSITINYGRILQNSGTVGNNAGVIEYNTGTVTTNHNEANTGLGTVSYNAGTVTANDGMVIRNPGTAGNTPFGTILNNTGGTLSGGPSGIIQYPLTFDSNQFPIVDMGLWANGDPGNTPDDALTAYDSGGGVATESSLTTLKTEFEKTGAVSGSDWVFSANTLQHAPTGGSAPTVEEIDAELTDEHGAGAWGPDGPGTVSVIVTCKDTDGNPLPNAQVWSTSDQAGANRISAVFMPNAEGIADCQFPLGLQWVWVRNNLDITSQQYTITG